MNPEIAYKFCNKKITINNESIADSNQDLAKGFKSELNALLNSEAILVAIFSLVMYDPRNYIPAH